MANSHSLDLELSSSQYAYITDGSQTGLDITGDITVEFWIKLEQLPSTAGSTFAVVGKGDWGNSVNTRAYYAFINSSDQIVLQYSDDGGSGASVTSISKSGLVDSGWVGNWKHIAITADVSASDGDVYVDGSDVTASSSGSATSIYNSNNDFYIGARKADGSYINYTDGLVDDVRVWNDIRTRSEIQANINSGASFDTTNLQGRWLLDNDYTDETANGNDLTASGSPVFSTNLPGDISASASVNTKSLDLELSSSQYAYRADTASLSITGDISIECWIKLEQLPSTAGSVFCIVSKYDSGNNKSDYNFALNTGDLMTVYWSSDGTAANRNNNNSDSAIVVSGDVGSWVHVACVIDVSEKTTYMYKNGSPVASSLSTDNGATSINDSDVEFDIGRAKGVGGSPSWYFDGLIDEVRVWNDIRTAQEIADNYNKQLEGDEAGLAGYWRLNGQTWDATSNENDLVLAAAPVFSTDVPFVGGGGTGFFAVI